MTAQGARRVIADTPKYLVSAVRAERVLPAAAPGTVVAQTPRAGTVATQVSVTIAVPPTVPCTAAQLALTYEGGGVGLGSDLGTLVVRDVSQSWCSFSGPVEVVGLDATGQAVTQTVSDPVPNPFAISALAPVPLQPPPVDGGAVPLGVIEANVMIMADYRDGPQPNGLCNTMQVVPAQWRVVLPGAVTLTVANDDPNNIGGPQQFTTCRGRMENPIPVKL
ncbi:MAG: hypothetical protein ACYC0E_14455 [Acidimicrobiales bacterium]